MNGLISISNISVRLKILLFLLFCIFSTVICNFHNHRENEIIEQISFNVENYSSIVDRQGSFGLFNQTITNQINKNKKKKRRHNRHTNPYSRDSHYKRNVNLIKSDAKRDYVSAIVGKDVQLDCKITESVHDDDKIVWLKMPKGEVLTLNSNRVSQDQRINSKCVKNMLPCWSLVIENTKESDSGFYICQTNAMQTKYIYLDIMVPPKLLTQYPLDRVDVNQTMNASIKCEFYGKPEPLVKWYKYHRGTQKEMEKYRGQSTINLFIHKDSASIYECVADNSIPPTISKKIYLNIQHLPQIKFQNSRVFQKVGERVIFDCHVNSNPPAKVSWFKNQKLLHESNKYVFESLENLYHRLYINNLTETDFTEYQCSAENMLGKSMSKIELIELPSEKLPVTTEIQTSFSSTSKLNPTDISNWPLITPSSISELKNNDKILQETVVEIPFGSTESEFITKFNSEYVNTDQVNPHHDATISSSNNYSTNRPNKLMHHEYNKTKHKIHRQNQYKRKQTPYRHRQIMTTSSISKIFYENSSRTLKITVVYALFPILSYFLALNNL